MTIAMAISLSTTLVGCGSDQGPTAVEGREYLEEFFVSFGQGADVTDPLYRTLDEALPNVTFVHPDAASNPNNTWKGGATTHVVVGTVTDVQRGKGFWIAGDDAPSGNPTDFNDRRSKWWTVHATVKVERAIGSEAPAEVRVQMPSEGPRDFDLMAAGLKGMGRAVFFLLRYDGDPLTSYDPSLYVVRQDAGLMMAPVAADGTLSLPFMAAERRAPLLRTRRLQDLEEKGRTPRAYPTTGGNSPQRADPEPASR